MRFIVLVSSFFLVALLTLPTQVSAQSNTHGCNWVSGAEICQGYVDCDSGFTHDPANLQNCNAIGQSGGINACNLARFSCFSAGGNPAPVPNNTAEQVQGDCPESHIDSAIGCIPFNDMNAIGGFFLRWALGIAGGVALTMIGFAAYRIMTSQGDPRRLQGGQELLLSAIGGLLMVILSVYLLRFIGVDLLGIF